MSPYDSRQIRAIFAEVLRRDPEERGEFLDRACADQPELRAHIEELLATYNSNVTNSSGAADALSSATAQRAAGNRVVGSYVLRQELGRGGMGVVYLADDTRLLRRVALKALAPGIAADPGSRERLKREARAAAALSHQGIATVYALEEIGDELYLAFEYVPGPSLRRILESAPLSIRQVLAIATQLARAIAAAHAHGVVHRDLKPENICRTPSGVVKVLDFGLARVESLTDARVTRTGTVVGTPAYMSPEQARGREVDFRTDLFSLGVVFYELVAGRNPFEAATVTATLANLIEMEAPPLQTVRADCPAELDRIVALCLRKDPAERYESAERLVDDLTRLELELASGTVPRASDRLRPPAVARGQVLVWWKAHLILVSLVYVAMIYPTWLVRRWLPASWGTVFLLGVLAAAAVATTLRLHLLFTASFDFDDLPSQQTRSRPWIRAADFAFCGALLAGALAIGSAHPEFSMLLVTVGVSMLAASLVIEPATTRTVLRRSSQVTAISGSTDPHRGP